MAHIAIGGNDPERMLRIAKSAGVQIIGNNNVPVLTLKQVEVMLKSFNASNQRNEAVDELLRTRQALRAVDDVTRDVVENIKELRGIARQKLKDVLKISRNPNERGFSESPQEQFVRAANNREIVAGLLVLQFGDDDLIDLCKRQCGNDGIADAVRPAKIADLSKKIADLDKVIEAISRTPDRFDEGGNDTWIARAAMAAYMNFRGTQPCDHAGRLLNTNEWKAVLAALEINTAVSNDSLFRPGKEPRWDFFK